MIWIYYAYTDILQNNNLDNFITYLPQELKSKMYRLKKQEDRDLLITSMTLLSKALFDNGYTQKKLEELQYSKTGRPFFADTALDFNISHTDKCAAVAFSNDCRVGIDVEKIKEIDFSDFTDYFTEEQWKDIYSVKNQFEKFYHYWTLIESGVKADGRGLSLIQDKYIRLVNKRLFIDNLEWFYNHLDINPAISCCLTANKKNEAYEIINITSI